MRISDWSSDVCSSDLALPRPGAARALPKTLSHADVDRLFAGVEARLARDPADPNDLRLSALVELLYGAGLRARELVSLPRNAVAPVRPVLILNGKGEGERVVPLPYRTRAAVAALRVTVEDAHVWLCPAGKGP